MIKYAVVEISGRQYLVEPNKPMVVDFLKESKVLECDRVLLKSEDGKLEIGKPFLTDKLQFDILEEVKFPKIRVATYKAKANTRKVKGSKRLGTKIQLKVK